MILGFGARFVWARAASGATDAWQTVYISLLGGSRPEAMIESATPPGRTPGSNDRDEGAI